MVVEIIVGLIILIAVMNAVMKIQGIAKGQDRCTSCKSKMKVSGGKYATVCSKCGRTWGES